MKIFFTSDPHGYHRNIAGPKVSKWKGGYRDFNDEFEMTEHIVKVFNQTVSEDDLLYCLGDWTFGGIGNIWKMRKQLRCKTIHLILGNHDQHIEENKFLDNLMKQDGIIFETTQKHEQELGLIPGRTHVCARDLFTSVQEVLKVKHGQHTFFMSHYSHRVWPYNHRGVIHLYGHSHNSIPDYGKSMDVGVDSAKKLLGDYRPFSIEEVISLMDRREIKAIDHHIE